MLQHLLLVGAVMIRLRGSVFNALRLRAWASSVVVLGAGGCGVECNSSLKEFPVLKDYCSGYQPKFRLKTI